jgi:hypothetical protein
VPREERSSRAFVRFASDVREGLAQVIGSVTADVMMAHILRTLKRDDIGEFTRQFEEVASSFFGSSSTALNAEVARWVAKKSGISPTVLTLRDVAKGYRER